MITNVYRDRPNAYPGTRVLEQDYGVVGHALLDLKNMQRIWTLIRLYAPVEGRAVGGLRAKLVDAKGFITFCNQRDLEVMLGLGHPGEPCLWGKGRYVGSDDPDWFGFCCDDDDLLDDTLEHELAYRARVPGGVLVPPLEIQRRVHMDEAYDFEETLVFLSDVDPQTGYYPDTRFETLERRWARSERRRMKW